MTELEIIKANKLADKCISNPSLLKELDDDTMIKFAIKVSEANKEKAVKMMDLKYPEVKPYNMVLFWEAVGIIQKIPSFK